MSVCDEGWGDLKICPACNFVDCRRTVPRPECVRPDNQPAGGANLYFCRYRKFAPCAVSEELPDSCNIAPLLKALPSASEQRIRFATLILQGDGDMVEEEYPFTEEARKRIPVLGVKQEWHNFMPAEREKGGSDE